MRGCGFKRERGEKKKTTYEDDRECEGAPEEVGEEEWPRAQQAVD